MSRPDISNEAADEFNPGRLLSERSHTEQEEIGTQSRPSALLIHETIRAEGESELARSAMALGISGLAAGLSMGASLLVEGLLREHLPVAPWTELISKLGYTAGFLIVVLGRQQLFTENTLTPMLPLLHNRDAATLRSVLKLWAVVLLGNLIGTAAIASVLAGTSAVSESTRAALLDFSEQILVSSAWTTMLKAVFAGWLIGLMVWLLPAAEGAAVPLVIIILTYIVSLGGFSHIIAGSVDGWFLLFSGTAGPAQVLGTFFIPTLIGNFLGGVTLVAFLNYGQVVSE